MASVAGAASPLVVGASLDDVASFGEVASLGDIASAEEWAASSEVNGLESGVIGADASGMAASGPLDALDEQAIKSARTKHLARISDLPSADGALALPTPEI